jgi:hypothetical protein
MRIAPTGLLLLTAAVGVSACGAGAGNALVPARCEANVRFVTGTGGAGNIWGIFEVLPRARCRIQGFPTVQLLGRGERLLSSHGRQRAGWGGIQDVPVVLGPNRPGRFLVITLTVVDGRNTCGPRPHAVRVHLPGARHGITVPTTHPKDSRGHFLTPCHREFIVTPIGHY